MIIIFYISYISHWRVIGFVLVEFLLYQIGKLYICLIFTLKKNFLIFFY